MAVPQKKIITVMSVSKDYKELPGAEFMQKYRDFIIRASKKHDETGQLREKLCEVSKYTTKDELQTDIKSFCDIISAENKLYRAKVRAVHRELKKGAINAADPDAVNKAKVVADNALKVAQENDPEIVQAMKKALEIQNQNITKNSEYPHIDVQGILSNPDIVNNMSKGSGSTFVLIGSSKSGKSTLMVKMGIMWKKLYPSTIVILISYTYNNDSPLYSSLKEVCGEEIVVTDKINESIALAQKIQQQTGGAQPILFLIDDVVTEKNNKRIMELFLTLRNNNISTIMAMQTCKLFNKNNRGNVNYIIAGRLANNEIIEDCFKTFLSGLYSGTKKVPDPRAGPNPTPDDYVPQYMVDYRRDTQNYQKIMIDQLNDKIYFTS